MTHKFVKNFAVVLAKNIAKASGLRVVSLTVQKGHVDAY